MNWFTPRDAQAATRWLRLALVACAVLPLFSPTTVTVSAQATATVLATSTCCALGAVAMRRGWVPGPLAWAGYPVVATVVAVACDLLTRDASATGLVYFLLPPILAGLHLRRGAAWITAGVSSAGLAVVVGVLLSPAQALSNWATVTALIAMLTALLFRKAQRTADLVVQLRHLAAVDPLTGLATRPVLEQAAAAALYSSHHLRPAPGLSGDRLATDRRVPRGCALLVIDVDHFKTINDTYGHPVGDAALKHLAHLLGVAVEGVNAQLAASVVLSRLGGDELAVLLPSTYLAAAQEVADEIVSVVREAPLGAGESVISLTVSVGLAHSPSHAHDVETLYRCADRALYDAKRAGRNRSATYGDRLGLVHSK